MKKRFKRGLTAIAEWCQENRHEPVDEQQKASTPSSGVTTNITDDRRTTEVSRKFYREVCRIWKEVAQPAYSWQRDDVGDL